MSRHFIFLLAWIAYLPTGKAAENSDCVAAKKVAEKFLKLETQGKRLYTDAEYDHVMTYITEDKEKGNEPAWDSATITDATRQPIIVNCAVHDASVDLTIAYTNIGESNSDSACRYSAKKEIEILTLKKLSVGYKVYGIQIYEPHVPLKTINKLLDKNWIIQRLPQCGVDSHG